MKATRLIAGVAIAVALVHIALAAAGQQAPPRDAPGLLPPGTATITGVVRPDNDANGVVRGAIVTLNHVDRTYGDTTIADESGRFRFDRVPSGRYFLETTKEGYVGMKYGAVRPGRAGTPVAVAEGARLDLALTIVRGAVLSGTVRSADGELLSNAAIVLQRVITSQNGRRFVNFPAGHGNSDDRGQYRIFGLTEGDYIVQVMPSLHFMHEGVAVLPTRSVDVQWARAQMQAASSSASEPPPGRRAESYAAVYFPAALQRSAAAVVTLSPGEERSGIDVTLMRLPGSRVTGTVAFPAGVAGGIPSIFLAEAMQDGTMFFGMQEAEGTSFSFSGVPPGQYTVVAALEDKKLWAMAELHVAGDDVNVALTLQAGLRVSGRIAFDGAAARTADPARVRLTLTPMSRGLVVAPARAVIAADGTFSIDGLMPGEYRLAATAPDPKTWTLLSAMTGDRDAASVPFTVETGAPPGPIAVTFTDRPTELSGRLQDSSGRAAADYFIIVFSTDDRSWYAGSRLVVQTRPANDGAFSVRGLPPGEYYLAALTDVQREELSDPAFLREIVPAAMRVTLAAGERKVQNVQIAGLSPEIALTTTRR
jgi:hypothetical protein